MAASVPLQAAAQQMPQQSQDTPAQAVGNQFVSQYYTVQHASPKHLHRFYSDASTLTFGDVRPDGFFSKNAIGQKTIHDLVMELGYEDTSTEIYTVDSQYSLGGGVVVQVTGIMQHPAGPKRPFVQTFFLAVQEKGYYVLNDIFRYLPLVPPADNGGAPAATAPAAASPAVPPAAAAASATMQQQQLAMQQLAMQQAGMQASMQAGEQPNGVAGARGQPPLPVAVQYTGYAAVPVPGGAAPPPRQPQPPKPAAEAARSGEPLSYAERLRQGGKTSTPGSPAKQQPQVAVPLPSAAPPPAAEQPPTPAGAAPPPAGEESVPGRQQAPQQQQQQQQQSQYQQAADAIPYEEQPIASIFVRGIPASVTMGQLMQKLEQYGRLRPGGVILKTQKGRDSFAFIDFEDAAPAQALLRQGMEIEGARLEVQPKRPLIFRPAMHGGRSDGGRSGGHNGDMGGRPGPGRYEGGMPGGGRGDRSGFRPGRGGGRGEHARPLSPFALLPGLT
ncbi:hypothetical protein CHLNCDRAFT_141731 [Chlorella variabilis]|uniref:NTF2 domain-containing protein n=1 Tax=Chlorella variabilis TaxID=554065 RepID=E1ZTH2_CHLVA|nr:hypothetical protein CHLNCDRAFT_141731 [Chlorella variabilis]EFN50901.1 hypothetical protein CHLNCDRAFT_141731 [Chlorella variabilis]|eukprot:XP_005843003.1 hypothetical protein CHLNCDRAFT_141731 [Chlorella variabilis]